MLKNSTAVAAAAVALGAAPMVAAKGSSKVEQNKAIVGRWFTEFWGTTIDIRPTSSRVANDQAGVNSLPTSIRARPGGLLPIPSIIERELLGCAARKLGQYAAREVGHLKDVHSTRL
jgi:hypothetical protein